MSYLLLSAYSQKTDASYLYEEPWTEYASALFSSVFLYAALFLALALFIIGAFVKAKKPQNFRAFVKIAAAVAVTFAVVVIVTMLAVGFAKIGEKGYAEEKAKLLVLVPPVVLSAVAVLGGVVSYVLSLYRKNAGKYALYAVVALLVAALIATFVCLAVYFHGNVKNDGYYDTEDGSYGKVNSLVLYAAAALLIVLELLIAAVSDKHGNLSFDSKSVALAGVCVSLSFALSYIKLWDLPQGGSVTLVSFLPVMLFSYIYGTKKGLFIGFVYGLLQSMQDPYVIHPAQYILDYPIAFSFVGLAGALKNVSAIKAPQVKFLLTAIFTGTARYIAHTVSGVFAFNAYAIDAGATSAFVYSAAYNAFIFLDIALVAAAGTLLLSSKAFVAETKKFGVNTRPRNRKSEIPAQDSPNAKDEPTAK